MRRKGASVPPETAMPQNDCVSDTKISPSHTKSPLHDFFNCELICRHPRKQEFLMSNVQETPILNHGCSCSMYKTSHTNHEGDKIVLKKTASLASSSSSFLVEEECSVDVPLELTQKCVELSNLAFEVLFQKDQLPEKWRPVLKNIVEDYITSTQLDILCNNPINKKVKIKKIPYKDLSLTKLVNGVIMRKNTISKDIKKGFYQVDASVLMIKSHLDEDADDLKSEDIFDIYSLKPELKEVISRILEVNPEIILVQGKVSKKAQALLAQGKKIVIPELTESQFLMLANLMKATPIHDISNLSLVTRKHLGICEKFSLLNFENKDYYPKKSLDEELLQRLDPSLMWFEEYKSNKYMTALISGPDFAELAKVKLYLSKLFPIIKTITLEGDIIDQEILLFCTQKKIGKTLAGSLEKVSANTEENLKLNVDKNSNSRSQILNRTTKATAGFMHNYLTQQIPLEKILKAPQAIITRFILSPLNFEKSPDLADSNDLARLRLEDDLKVSGCWNQNSLCQIEGEPLKIEADYWMKNLSVGNYLFEKAATASERCGKCHYKKHTHTYFYSAIDMYIKVKVSPKAQKSPDSPDDLKKIEKSSSLSNSNPQISGSFLNLLESFWSPSSPIKKGISTAKDCTTPKTSPAKTQNVMYLECSKCKARVSEQIELRQSLLEYSFPLYIERMIRTAYENLDYFKKQRTNCDTEGSNTNIKETRNEETRTCCISSPKNRVFVINQVCIRFGIGYLNQLRLNTVNYQCMNTLRLVENFEYFLIKEKQIKLNKLQNNITELLTNNMKRLLSYLYNIGQNSFGLRGNQDSYHKEELKIRSSCNLFWFNLALLCQKVINFTQERNSDSQREVTHHLEIDEIRKQLYYRILKLTQEFKESKNKLLKLLQEILNHKNLNEMPNQQQETTRNFDSFQVYLDEINAINPQKNHTLQIRDIEELYLKSKESSLHQTEENLAETEHILMKKLTHGLSSASLIDESKELLQYVYIPLLENNIPSIIANALNSSQYMTEVSKRGGFLNTQSPAYNCEKYFNIQFSSNKLAEATPFKFILQPVELELICPNRILSSLFDKIRACISPIRTPNQKIMTNGKYCSGSPTKKNIEIIETSEYEITCHYPSQFEAFRTLNGISLKDYISSLSSSRSWEENNGGKTGAKFFKTNDERFVFKEIQKKEFNMLLKFAQPYLAYMSGVCFKKQESLLSKIFGIYEINDEIKVRYFIAMENLFFGTEGDIKVYDLKGSELNRYLSNKVGEKKTLLDTNYKVNRNGEPLPIRSEYYEFIQAAIRNDTEFLASHGKIDYSMLLIYDEEKAFVRMGIIDYLRNYDLEKQLEHVGKLLIKGSIPTIIAPEDYKERFKKSMRKYLMPVHNDK